MREVQHVVVWRKIENKKLEIVLCIIGQQQILWIKRSNQWRCIKSELKGANMIEA